MQKVNLSQPIWKKVLFVILATVAVVCAVTAAVLPLSKGDLANADSQTVECLVMGNEPQSLNYAVAYFYSDHHFANGTLTDDDRAPKIAVGSGSSAEYQLFNNTLHEDMFEDMWYEFRPCTATHEQWEANWREYPAASSQYSSYFKEGVTHDFRSDSTHRAIPYDDVYHISKCRMCDQTMLIAHNLENGVCVDCGWQDDVVFLLNEQWDIIGKFYAGNDPDFKTSDYELFQYGSSFSSSTRFTDGGGLFPYDQKTVTVTFTWTEDHDAIWNSMYDNIHDKIANTGRCIHDFCPWDDKQIMEDFDSGKGHIVICSSCGYALRVPHRYNNNGECIDCGANAFHGENYNAITARDSSLGLYLIWGVFDQWTEGNLDPILYDKEKDVAVDCHRTLGSVGDITAYNFLWEFDAQTAHPSLATNKDSHELNNNWFIDAYGAYPDRTHDFRVKEPNSAIYLTSRYHLVECSMCGLQVAVGHTFDGSGKCIYCDNDCSEHIYYNDSSGDKKVWGIYSVNNNRTVDVYERTEWHLTPKQPDGTLTLNSTEQNTSYFGQKDGSIYVDGVFGDGWLATNYPSPVEHSDREPLGLPYTDEYTHDFRVKPGEATCVDLQYHTVKCSCGETIQVEHRLNSDGICIDCNEKPHESEQVTRSWTFTLDDAVQFTAQGDGTVTATINVSAKGIVLGEGDVLSLYVKSGNATDDEKFRILLTDGIAIGYTVSCNSDDHGKTADNTYDNDKGLLLWQLTWGSGQDPLNEDFTVTLTLKAPAQFAGEWKDSLTFTAVLVEA